MQSHAVRIQCMCVCTYSIQCLNESKTAFDSPLHHANSSEAGGTKITLSYLWKKLTASGVDVEALWADICSVVIKSLVCVEGYIPNQPNWCVVRF